MPKFVAFIVHKERYLAIYNNTYRVTEAQVSMNSFGFVSAIKEDATKEISTPYTVDVIHFFYNKLLSKIFNNRVYLQ